MSRSWIRIIFNLLVFVVILIIIAYIFITLASFSDPDYVMKKRVEFLVNEINKVCNDGGSASYSIDLLPNYDIVFEGNKVKLIKFSEPRNFKFILAKRFSDCDLKTVCNPSGCSEDFNPLCICTRTVVCNKVEKLDNCNNYCQNKKKMEDIINNTEKVPDGLVVAGFLIPNYTQTVEEYEISCGVKFETTIGPYIPLSYFLTITSDKYGATTSKVVLEDWVPVTYSLRSMKYGKSYETLWYIVPIENIRADYISDPLSKFSVYFGTDEKSESFEFKIFKKGNDVVLQLWRVSE